MTTVPRLAAIFGVTALLITGCKKTDDNKINFTNAINTWYAAHPACIWDEPIKLPVQVATSDTAKTTGYDALVDQELLERTTLEKKVFIVVSKEVNNYDLTDKGRSNWTADITQPGFGNFCYGHRSVATIDSTTPTSNQPGATTQVGYHFSFSGAPSWASDPETQTAFPDVQANLTASQSASATLVNTPSGWIVQAPPPSHKTITPADGKIVE